MGWHWRFVDLDDEAKDLRRHTLDRYAGYAQLSAFVPIVVFLLFRFSLWVLRTVQARRGSYDAVPTSPTRKALRKSPLGTWEARFRRLQWWLEDDVVFLGQAWGRKDEWMFGLAWGFWMLLLSVPETGDGELPECPMRLTSVILLTRRRLLPSYETVRYNRHLTATAPVPSGIEESQPGRLLSQLVA